MGTNSQFRVTFKTPGRAKQVFFRKKIQSLIGRVPEGVPAVVESQASVGRAWVVCGAIIAGEYHKGSLYGLAVLHLGDWEQIPHYEVNGHTGGWKQLASSAELYIADTNTAGNVAAHQWKKHGLAEATRRFKSGWLYRPTADGQAMAQIMQKHLGAK